MKKLILLFTLAFTLCISSVNADTKNYIYKLPNENFTFDKNINVYSNYKDIYLKLYEGIYQDYILKYRDTYPYYSIYFKNDRSCITCEETDDLHIYMYMYSSKPSLNINSDNLSNSYVTIKSDYVTEYSYDIKTDSYILPIKQSETSLYVNPFTNQYYYSNFDLLLNLEGINSINVTTFPTSNYTLALADGNIFPTTQSFFNIDLLNESNINDGLSIEINLNDYSYIALSLKDYSKIPENGYSTYVNFDIKGMLCITPVYNYGQTERKDVITGTQIQACSNYYNEFTAVRFYILPDDVKNHAIYYLKSYDSTKDNIVKIDSSFFDISYVTEENKDNPKVEINGKLYPTLSYDSLTDTATKSEDEGYTSGVTCGAGDLNCYIEHNPENIFSTLFDKPLEIMENIWSSITSVFDIITEFISLLPKELQACMYLSFILALILGILKIIL